MSIDCCAKKSLSFVIIMPDSLYFVQNDSQSLFNSIYQLQLLKAPHKENTVRNDILAAMNVMKQKSQPKSIEKHLKRLSLTFIQYIKEFEANNLHGDCIALHFAAISLQLSSLYNDNTTIKTINPYDKTDTQIYPFPTDPEVDPPTQYSESTENIVLFCYPYGKNLRFFPLQ